MDDKIRTACEGIPPDAWVEIKYPQAVWDEDESGGYPTRRSPKPPNTAFAGTRWQVTARLVVRRVKRLDQQQVAGQGELLPGYRYHAVFQPRSNKPGGAKTQESSGARSG